MNEHKRFKNIDNIIESGTELKNDYVKSFIEGSSNFLIDLTRKNVISWVDIWDALHYYECCEELFKKITKMDRYYFEIVKKHNENFPECVNKSYMNQYITSCSSIDRDFYIKSPPEKAIRYIEEDLNVFSFKHLFFHIIQRAERLIDNEIYI